MDDSRDGSSNALKVRLFHEAIGESPPRAPEYPDERLLALRRKLIEEEVAEVLEALDAFGVALRRGDGDGERGDGDGGAGRGTPGAATDRDAPSGTAQAAAAQAAAAQAAAAQAAAAQASAIQAATEREQSFAAVAHELVDLLYVTYGALVWFGVDADAVFEEVHSANMRKTSGPKRADGKQLKPPGWQPADVASVIASLRRRDSD